AEEPIAFQTSGDRETTLPSSFPDPLGAVPRIEQDMGCGISERLELADAPFHQLNFAHKGHPFEGTGLLLAVELRFERTATAQKHIERLNQTVTFDSCGGSSRVMVADALHLLAAHLVAGAVITDQVSSHNGCFRAADPPGLGRTVVGMTVCHCLGKGK